MVNNDRIYNVCLALKHDFRLLSYSFKKEIMDEVKQVIEAWEKEIPKEQKSTESTGIPDPLTELERYVSRITPYNKEKAQKLSHIYLLMKDIIND